jgi:hypothetical protein
MSYTLPVWADLPATTSALDTANLSLYNTAINDLDSRVTAAQTDLTVTAVKTSNYTANAYEFVPVDTTSGNVTVTFPTAPLDKVNVGAAQVVRGGVNTVTLQLGGSDKFNTNTGPTTNTLTLLNDAATFQYVAASSTWVSLSDDSSLTSMDIRYKNVPVTLTDAATVITNAALGNYFRWSTATSTRILGIPTNPTDGQTCIWELQNTAGGTTFSVTAGAGGFNMGPVAALTLTVATKIDILTATYSATRSQWLVTSVLKGY